MHSLDMRTRTKADVRPIDLADFFDRELPSLIRARGEIAAPGAIEFGIRPTSFVTSSGSWTLACGDDTLTVAPGDSGLTAIQIGHRDFQDFINDLVTPDILCTMERARLTRGTQDDMEGWWAVIRSLVDGRPMYTRGSVQMLDRDGRNLDLSRSFTSDDDDAGIGHFLAEAGFLHLSGWFDAGQMAEISADMDRELAKCTPDDGSWWGAMADGSRQPIRISNFAARSPALRRLMASDAYRRIAALAPGNFAVSDGGEALHKPVGVVRGVNALAWHHDCTLGMHSYKCCQIVIGISVTGAGPGSSQLSVLPGSHRALMPNHRYYPETGFEPRAAPTRTGDVTVHCSCTMHMSEDPTLYGRRVVYIAVQQPVDEETTKLLDELQARYRDIGTAAGEADSVGEPAPAAGPSSVTAGLAV